MTISINIEIANNEDVSKLKELLKKLYLELGEEAESVKFLTDALVSEMSENGKTMILKAVTEKGQIIGLLTLTETQAIYAGGKYGVIDEMYVLPEFRSEAIGESLIIKAALIGKERGWKRIDVTGPTFQNERTIKFYENNGFIYTGPKMKLVLT